MKTICANSKAKSSPSKTPTKPKETKSNNLLDKKPLREVFLITKLIDSRIKSTVTKIKSRKSIAFTPLKSNLSITSYNKKTSRSSTFSNFTET
jgi:hypothetical protein